MSRVRSSVCGVVMGMVLAMSFVGSPALAQPDVTSTEDDTSTDDATAADTTDVDTGSAVVDESVVMSWQSLGLGDDIVFDAVDTERFVQVPVPTGSSMRALTGQLRSPVQLGRGYLEVTSADGRFLGSAEIPDLEAGQRVTPFSIDLTGAVVDGGVGALRMSVRPFDRTNSVCGPAQRLTAADLAVSFTAVGAAPATVQQFFPSLLQSVEVFVDPVPTKAEKQTVLSLAAAVVRRYDPIPVSVFVRLLDRTAPIPAGSGGLARSVVVRDREAAAAGVIDPGGGPILVLSGTDSTLVDQVGLFPADLDQLVQSSAGSVTRLGADTILGTDTLSFQQLGSVASTSVLGSAQLFSGFDASSFGLADPGTLDVHLLADHTPVSDGADATMVISAGGQVVHSQELDSSGRVDTTFAVTGGAIARTVGLNVALTYSPENGCTPFTAPMQFSIDPESTVTVSGSSGGAGGFGALPTSLMPTYQVAFDEQDPEAGGLSGLTYATRAVAAMQTMANTPMRPIVAPMAEVAGSDMGALVVSDAEALAAAGIAAPLSVVDGAVNVAARQKVSFDVDGGIGSLQVFAEGARTVVAITTTDSWSLVGPVLERAAAGGGWSALTGDVVAAGRGGVAVPLTVVTDGPSGAVLAPARGWVMWLWIGIAGAIVAAAVIGVGLWSNRRGSRAASGR